MSFLTTKSQNGEIELTNVGTNYVDEKLKELEADLDKIESEARLAYVIGGKEIDDILLWSEDQLEKLTPEECDRCAFLCLQYVIELQKKVNRARAIRNWANKKIDIVVGQEYTNYYKQYYPVDVIRASIIADNSFAKRLQEVAQSQETIVESLSDMTKHVTQLSLTLKNMGYNKKAENVSYREN